MGGKHGVTWECEELVESSSMFLSIGQLEELVEESSMFLCL